MTPASEMGSRAPPSIQLIVVDVSAFGPSDEELDDALALLQPASAERIRRFRRRPDALRCLTGRLIPLYALWEEQISPAGPVRIATTSHGRPHFEPPLGLDWNVSHDGRLVVGAWCACAESRPHVAGKLGVDVMRLGLPEGFPDYDTLAGSLGDLLAPVERQALAALREDTTRTEHLIRLWTLKEAVAKLLGLGAALDFGGLAFDLPYTLGATVKLASSANMLPESLARTIAFWEGRLGPKGDTHAVALAYWAPPDGEAAKIRVRETSVEDIMAGARAIVQGTL